MLRKVIISILYMSLVCCSFAYANPDSIVIRGGDLRIRDAGSGLVFPDGSIQYKATVEGPIGLQGAKGDTGPQGIPGAKGDTGQAATVTLDSICNAIAAGNKILPSFCSNAINIVSATFPANASTAVKMNSKLTATFNVGMDPTTITTTTFTLKQGVTPVQGNVSYSGLTALFTPTNNLAAGTTYTATITTGAKDLAGNALSSYYVWSFTTESVIPTAWTNSVSGTTSQLNAVVYGDGKFVAVGSSGTILTSPDGITWTTQASGTTSWLGGITYAVGQYVVVGANGAVLTSPNGINWTTRTSATVNQLNNIYYGSGLYVAVGSSGRILTSPDGIIWTLRASGTTKILYGVTYGKNQFVAVGSFSTGIADSTTILTSPDGINWIPRSASLSFPGIDLRSIIYNGQYYIAVTSSSNIYLKSIDGINWTNIPIFQASGMLGVAYYGAKLVAVGINTISSLDGTNWTVITPGTSNWLYGVVYGAEKFVAVGESGTILTNP